LQWFQLKQSTAAQAPTSKNEPVPPALQMSKQMFIFSRLWL